MRRITFKGTPFVFTEDSFEESGAIATEDDYVHGRVSYAHWWPADNMVSRYGERIGGREDLADLGPVDLTFDFEEALAGLLLSSSWPWNQR